MRMFITVFTVAVMVSSCGSDAKKADSEKDMVKVDRPDYSIAFSKEWENAPNKNPTIDLFITAQPDGKTDRFSENINVLIQNVGDTMNLEQFEKLTKSQLGTMVPGSELTSSKITKKNGTDCLQMEYKAPMNGLDLQFVQDVYMKNSKVYILTFSAEQASYQAYKSMAQKVLNTFKLK